MLKTNFLHENLFAVAFVTPHIVMIGQKLTKKGLTLSDQKNNEANFLPGKPFRVALCEKLHEITCLVQSVSAKLLFYKL